MTREDCDGTDPSVTRPTKDDVAQELFSEYSRIVDLGRPMMRDNAGVLLRAAKRIAALERVAEAARDWWLSQRPIHFSEIEHRKNPCVNCSSSADDALALSVAALDADAKEG